MFEKESFYPSAALNCAITDTSVSFDPQLPLGNKAGTSLSPESDRLIPPGIMMLKDVPVTQFKNYIKILNNTDY